MKVVNKEKAKAKDDLVKDEVKLKVNIVVMFTIIRTSTL